MHTQILLGKLNPSGKLPLTYPKSVNSVPIRYWHKPSFNTLGGPQWEYGFGMSFSQFVYSNFATNQQAYRISDSNFAVIVTFTLTNKGPFDGKETVLLFVDDDYRSIEKEVKLLKAFAKYDLRRGQAVGVKFTLTKRDFSFTGLTGQLMIEPGSFTLRLGVGTSESTTKINLIA